MISIEVGEVSTFRFGSEQAELHFSADGELTVRTTCRPVQMGILRPDSSHEFLLMCDCFDGKWRSLAIAERIQPGSRLVLGIGGDQFAIEVISNDGSNVCLVLGTESPEPRSA